MKVDGSKRETSSQLCKEAHHYYSGKYMQMKSDGIQGLETAETVM